MPKLYQMLTSFKQINPNLPAMRYMGKTITYQTFLKKIDEYAAKLAGFNIKEGGVVTICMPNIPQCIYALYAVNMLGLKAHLVHPLAPLNQLSRFMESANSQLLLTLSINVEKYLPISKKTPIVYAHPAGELNFILKTAFDIKNKKSPLLKSPDVFNIKDLKSHGFKKSQSDSADTAVYLHSGGTSGEPKIIELSDDCINALAVRGLEILGIDNVDNKYMLGVLPIFHGFGLAMGIHATLINGGACALMPRFSAKQTVKLIAQNKLHFLIGVPALYEALLKHKSFCGKKLKNIFVSFVGGDCTPQKLFEQFDNRIKSGGGTSRLFEGYGLTETVTVCTVNTYKENKSGSVGKPLKNLCAIVIDPETQKILKPENYGELCFSGDTLMKGYLNNDSENNEVFFDYNGQRFVKTGDLGCIDSDGYVYFKQRLKRIIKIAGISVYPVEIENAALSLVSGGEACAVEYQHNNKTRIALFLTGEKNVSDEQICEAIKNELSYYAVPKKIIYLDKIPKTLIGKADTQSLQKYLQD